ncbi:hypothetical protein TSTA_091910 [Talaromyces stipitatus ATCC 10500]|uniref:Beta-glucuronidase C-terminal domain-containing protein n=1 Tax=Talaromyces stipitatus (strain ATCC 10500 / CBS 375.48 / QM 6759 / NRRL 1006) TaxID=441959 RepID=B8M2N9_TALSN|nr:uncharacterized protein TSTA_091910 [Talaromyces stipitatus ATCC 10500]EED21950.1 hypothetical protein TSTA_091910 [Talaromyces stipitatus ATCC 10500]
MEDVDATETCLQNLKELTGTWPPIRVGGTTRQISWRSDTRSQPRLDNLSNTVAAAKLAKSQMGTLYAIELVFTNSDPIANGDSWTAAADYVSEIQWQNAVCGNLSVTDLIPAGVSFGTFPMRIADLTAVEGTASIYDKDYCFHNYPQFTSTANLSSLMSHSGIESQTQPFAAEVSAAAQEGKPHVLGETNSGRFYSWYLRCDSSDLIAATGGGGGISPTFSEALWILDYTNPAYKILGQYCWWGRYDIEAPYYGAYFVNMALAGTDSITALDDQTTAYAAYAIFESDAVARVLLYNWEYYTSGTRPNQTFSLTGLSPGIVTAKRLTAPYAASRVDYGGNPTVAGRTFVNGTCTIQGTAVEETTTVSGGEATFTIGASEALLVYV